MVERKPNTIRRYREVRAVYNKLVVKYRSDKVMEFIATNYFMDASSVYFALQKSDSKPVENPSIIYLTVMRDDFHL